MATLTLNQFTQFEMGDEEHLQGCILSVAQEQVLRNEMAVAATQLINMDAPTAESLVDFSRNWASIQSRVRTINDIIDRSEQARQALAKLQSLSATGHSN